MKRDDLEALAGQGGEGLGCEPLGHLASPFLDGELPSAELGRFDTHLPGCAPCRLLLSEYRGLDALARPAVPAVAEEAWGRVWGGVQTALQDDRQAAGAEPLAPMLDAAERFSRKPVPRALRPVLYLAASLALVALLFAVQRAAVPGAPGSTQIASAKTPELECLEPDYMPVAYMIGDGDDAVSVMYCAYVGADT